MRDGYVYFGIVNIGSLEGLIKEFFSGDEVFFIKEVIDTYEPNYGLPQNISKKGRTFSDKGEVRWEEKYDGYHTLILTENRPDNLPAGISKVNGNWMVEQNIKFYLVPVTMGHISPNFEQYPNDAEYIIASIYKRNGISTFISPRRFIK